MNSFSDILHTLKPLESVGDLAVKVAGITADSRQVKAGWVFVAVKGTQSDGHNYIAKAIELGAVAVICEQMPNVRAENVAFVRVDDSAEALGVAAHNFHGQPSHSIRLVGVTGTNGKTTVATLLFRMFGDMGYKCGLLSTVENRIGEEVIPSTHTTPDAPALNALLARMVEERCDFAFMEVSSHSTHQRRIAGLKFEGGIFTNITHDHLDYHGTFANYIAAKKMFFDGLPSDGFALTNIDDKNGEVMLQNTLAKRNSYALRRPANFKTRILENNLTGLVMEMDGTEIHARLVGDFNAYNLTAVYGTAILMGEPKEKVLTALSNLAPAEGRFDVVQVSGVKILGIVDYAHTPDALEKVLQTLQEYRQAGARILTLVGCGGDRDTTKRPKMAKIACMLSDQAILTSDNPRSEQPEAILKQMEEGITPDLMGKSLTISDRRQAIRTAVKLAKDGDVILLAGKGHEKYQEIQGVKHPFDDKEELRNALQAAAST